MYMEAYKDGGAHCADRHTCTGKTEDGATTDRDGNCSMALCCKAAVPC